jgi:hypothetical protein
VSYVRNATGIRVRISGRIREVRSSVGWYTGDGSVIGRYSRTVTRSVTGPVNRIVRETVRCVVIRSASRV